MLAFSVTIAALLPGLAAAIFVGLACLSLALVQSGVAAYFCRLLSRPGPPRIADDELPKAAILIALKGADPELVAGLCGLMRQDYPCYEMRIVVDRREDPAWDAVEEALRRSGASNVFVSEHVRRHETCGMHCSALVQAARDMSNDCEVVVTVDGDVVAHADLLRDLVAPLARDNRVGAAFGNRWFMPAAGQWGSLVRYLWNAAAVAPMYFSDIIWGGACAIRRSAMDASGMVDKWERAIVFDGLVVDLLKQQGLQVRFVPTLMMVNREECSLGFALDFFKRQLMWTRIYSSGWIHVVGHALVSATLLATAAGLGLFGLVSGRMNIAAWAGGGLLVYFVATLLTLLFLEYSVRRVVRVRGEPVSWCSFWSLLKIILAVPLTQLVYLIALAIASFQRDVRFRASVYRVRGPWDVELISYAPITKTLQPAGGKSSL